MTDFKCGRCKVDVDFEQAEVCWWCMDYLCYDCWDEFGHCGHNEADELNAEARSVERINRAITQNAREAAAREAVEKLRETEGKQSRQNRFENGRLKF